VKDTVGVGLVGLALGFALSRIGFSSWDEVHRMFTFADLRLFLTFCSSVAILLVAWWVVRKVTGAVWSERRVHPGTIAGGVMFGVGWALTGACPAIALVQLGEGQLAGGLTLAGILGGNWIYSVVHERYFRWSAAGCADV
jgi:uncharacterized membrane protein YedE/YeeE